MYDQVNDSSAIRYSPLCRIIDHKMATFALAVGWFLIICGIAAFVVPMVIRIPDIDAEAGKKSLWMRVRDPVTLIGLGLLTIFFPLRVHVLVFVATIIGGQFIRRARTSASRG